MSFLTANLGRSWGGSYLCVAVDRVVRAPVAGLGCQTALRKLFDVTIGKIPARRGLPRNRPQARPVEIFAERSCPDDAVFLPRFLARRRKLPPRCFDPLPRLAGAESGDLSALASRTAET